MFLLLFVDVIFVRYYFSDAISPDEFLDWLNDAWLYVVVVFLSCLWKMIITLCKFMFMIEFSLYLCGYSYTTALRPVRGLGDAIYLVKWARATVVLLSF